MGLAKVGGQISGDQPSGTGAPGAALFQSGLLLTLVGVFFGGLALNLTPCVYPLIPVTVSYFGGRGRDKAGLLAVHSLFYLLGLAVTNSTLGVVAALTGGLLGTVLQHPAVLNWSGRHSGRPGLELFRTLGTQAASRSYSGYGAACSWALPWGCWRLLASVPFL